MLVNGHRFCKKMALTAGLLAAVFCFSATRVSAASVYLYQPNFPGNGTSSNSVGLSGAASNLLSVAGWKANYTANGTVQSTTQSQTNEFVQTAASLLTQISVSGNVMRNTNVLLWTENFAVTNVDVQKLTEVMFYQQNSTNTTKPRLALRIGGAWYASVNIYSNQSSTANLLQRTTLTAADLAAMNFYSLTFVSGSSLVLNTGSSTAFSALSGNVDAAGMYYDTTATGSSAYVRLREFTVASPAPVFTLTVNGGSGGGSYSYGTQVPISANTTTSRNFVAWIGDTNFLSSNTVSTTVSTPVNMSTNAVTLTATYDLTSLTVNGGTGGGLYTSGANVAITASNIPGEFFVAWTGATQYVASAASPTTTVTVPVQDIALTAKYTLLYQPNVAGNSNSNSLGHGGGTTNHLLSSVSWKAHYTTNGTAQSTTANQTNEFVQSSAALLTQCVAGNVMRSQKAILWTENFAVTNVDVQKLSEVMFYQQNATNLTTARLALRVGGSWYASANTYQAITNIYERTTLSAANLAAMSFYPLNFIPGSSLVLDTESGLAFSTLSGAVNAAGLYYDDTSTDYVRLREFTVAVAPVYKLTVNSGAGGGWYTNGEQVAISATVLPAPFIGWIGDTQYVAGVSSSNTTVTMPAQAVNLTATYVDIQALTVNNGSGGGWYTNGQQVAISANVPAIGKAFSRWIGDTQYVNNVTYTNALVTMPTNGISLTATYVDVYYTLTVNNGTGGGSYTNGAQVAITASNIPGKTATWTGATQYVANASSASTTVTMPAQAIALTATYTDTLYALTVTGGSGSGSYTNGQQIGISATVISGKTFDRWTGSGTQNVASVDSASTTVTMPAQAIALTSTYTDTTYLYLYQPNFPENGTSSNSVGSSGAASNLLSNAGWKANYSVNGTVQSTTRAQGAEFVQTSATLLTQTSITGNPMRNTSVLLWTENFAVTNVDIQGLTEVMFYQKNTLTTPAPRLALRIGGSWYASVSVYSNKVADTYERTTLTATDLAAMSFYPLNFVSGSSLVLNTESNTAFSALSGNVDAAGLYYDTTLAGSYIRLAEFTVQAIGYKLTVNGGTGGGLYSRGHVQAIAASNSLGKVFVEWIGDTQYLAGAASVASNMVTMPAKKVSLTATYANTYLLTVNSGTGGGWYTNGQRVAIAATVEPAAFIEWIGDTQYVASVSSSNTTVIMTNTAITLTATYGPFQRISYWTNSIAEVTNLFGGAANGRYEPGETIDITVSNRNDGNLPVSSVINSLSANTAFFTISNQTSQYYPALAVGAVTSTTYRVTILPAATNGTYWFSVTNQAGPNIWSASFPLNVFKQGFPLVSPPSIAMSVLSGAAATNTEVTVTNSGNAAFTFSITDDGSWGSFYDVTIGKLGKTAFVKTYNNVIVLKDPNTNSVNISSTNAGVSSAINIGFSFPFYGTTYSNFYVTADGYIGLGNTTNVPAQSADRIGPLPVTSATKQIIAPFWGALNSPAGSIRYARDSKCLAISFSGVSKEGGAKLGFQMALFTNGCIEFRYATIAGVTNSYGQTNVTIGVQGSAASYTNLTAVQPVGGTSIRLTPQKDQWVSYAPAQDVTVAPLSSQVITFIADAAGKTAATSAAFSAWFNWSTGGSNAVSVSANVIAAVPVYSAVSSLSFTGAAGQVTSVPFVITNAGTGPLTFTISNSAAASAGYTSTNPAYSWIDISSTGTKVTLQTPAPVSPNITAADEGFSAMIPMKFVFPFYGGIYSQFCVSVNGALRLDTTGRVYVAGNLALTNSLLPAQMIAPYWGDLVMDANATIKYRATTNQLVITWENIQQRGMGGGSNQTFQAVLKPSGDITFQYKKLEGAISWPNTPIGLRDTVARTKQADIRQAGDRMITTNLYGSVSTQYVNAVSNRAVQFHFAQIQTIRYTPAGGTIAVGSNAIITVIGDASSQSDGTNNISTTNTLTITHNAYSSPDYLAVTFTVTNSFEAAFVRAKAGDSAGAGLTAGTGTQAAVSVFSPKVEGVPGAISLSWTDETQRTYTIYSKTDLMASAWDYLATVTNGMTYLDTRNMDVPTIYYKVTVE